MPSTLFTRFTPLRASQHYQLKDFFLNNNDADVTLVSDDKVAFPAHKFILSAFSSVFKDLFLKHPHPHPMIYLNGVKQAQESLAAAMSLSGIITS